MNQYIYQELTDYLDSKIKYFEKILPAETIYGIFLDFECSLHEIYIKKLYLLELEYEAIKAFENNSNDEYFGLA